MKKILLAVLLVATLFCSQVFAEPQWPKKTITIKVWYSISGENGNFFLSQVKAFEALHPNIKVETTYTGTYADSATKISAAKLSNRLPDMAITSSAQLYTGEDGNYSIEKSVTTDAEFNLADIQSGIMDYAKYEGHICSLPFSISTPVMYYNKALAAKAGYDLEKNPPKTWDEFIKVAKAIMSKSGSRAVKGFDVSDVKWLFKCMLVQNGNEVVSVKNGKITPIFQEASGIEVGKFWQKLIDEKIMAVAQHSGAENKFKAGNLVFFCASSNKSNEMLSYKFEVGAIPMPYFKKPAVAFGGSTATIFSTDQWQYTASYELLKFLLNTTNQADYAIATGYLPIRKSSLELAKVKKQFAENKMYKVAADQMEYGFAYYMFGQMGSMDDAIVYAIDNIEYGDDPADALAEAAKDLIADLK